MGQPRLSQGGAQLWPDHGDSGETTIVEVSQLVALGDLDPENIITPGIFVQRVFSLENLTAAQRA
ncbi:CoA-transferase [Klebsiella pneumoniae]